jgi:hypothetical protein
MRRHYAELGLLLAVAAILGCLWPRYQAYRLYREVDAKAKLCRKNVANVGLACQMYQDDFNCVPSRVSALTPKYLKAEPRCPFDGSAYQAEQILVTPENVDCFMQGLIETLPGFLGVKVRCTSPLHSTFQPNLQPGYGGAGGFLQCQSESVVPLYGR